MGKAKKTHNFWYPNFERDNSNLTILIKIIYELKLTAFIFQIQQNKGVKDKRYTKETIPIITLYVTLSLCVYL